MSNPTWGFWATEFIRELSLPLTRQNKVAILAWMRKENTKATWNPLATTHKAPGSWDFNSMGVQHFRSFTSGMTLTVSTIQNKQHVEYSKILGAMAANRPSKEIAALVEASPWGTGSINVVNASNHYDALSNKLLGETF